MATVGWQVDPLTLDVVLPVGISFYTFQTLSYTLDVYRKKLEPTNDLLQFAVFVSFFPQAVAGPIERARRFCHKVARPRTITPAAWESGLVLVTWGLFKKMVLADNAALTDPVFDNPAEHAGLDLWLGALAFTLQPMEDFSACACTDIARGLAKWLEDPSLAGELPAALLCPRPIGLLATSGTSRCRRGCAALPLHLARRQSWHLEGTRTKPDDPATSRRTVARRSLERGSVGRLPRACVGPRRMLRPLTARLPERQRAASSRNGAGMFGITVRAAGSCSVLSMAHLEEFVAGSSLEPSSESEESSTFRLAQVWAPLWGVRIVISGFSGDLMVMRRRRCSHHPCSS